MPDSPRLPSSRRRPGRLVRNQDLAPPAPPKELTQESIIEYVKALATFLPKFTANQDDLNRYLWLIAEGSLPGLHGRTHLGGEDNIVSGTDPSAITLTSEADPGTPQLGVAAGNHTHEVDLDFEANPIPQGGVGGNPNPPFSTLEQQTDWLNSMAARDYALNIFKAGIR